MQGERESSDRDVCLWGCREEGRLHALNNWRQGNISMQQSRTEQMLLSSFFFPSPLSTFLHCHLWLNSLMAICLNSSPPFKYSEGEETQKESDGELIERLAKSYHYSLVLIAHPLPCALHFFWDRETLSVLPRGRYPHHRCQWDFCVCLFSILQ